jgi:MFS family permease
MYKYLRSWRVCPTGKKQYSQILRARISIVKGEKPSFYYGWVIVGVSSLTLFVALGIRYSFGVFYVAILQEYGWGRAETAGAFSLAMVIHALFAMATGTLIDRVGPRVLFPLGAIFLAMGLAAASRITTIWHLYLFFGVVMAMGTNTLAFAPHMSRIPRWFIRRRGLAGGLVAAGIGVGTLVMAPTIQFIIDTVDWHHAFLILAAIVIMVVVPITALFQRRSPEEVGQFPDGIIPTSSQNGAPNPEASPKDNRACCLPEEWTLRTTLRTRAFWWMALVNFAAGITTNTLVVHQAAKVVDAGYTATLAASIVGFVGLLRSVGGVLCSHFSDRVGREIAYTIGASSAFAGVLIFLLIRDTSAPWMLYAFVVLFGLGSGTSGPLCAATAGDLWPGDFLGRIMGTFAIAYGVGSAVGPYLGGYFYDHLGSYTLPFSLVMAIISMGSLGMWMAAPRHRRTISPQGFANAVSKST